MPFYEDLPEEMVGLGDLVPYQLEYRCLRLKELWEADPAGTDGNKSASIGVSGRPKFNIAKITWSDTGNDVIEVIQTK